ncbi:DUF2509 family protein [Enterobacter soli]|uniref:DUF2509 family protein n=1 Tax=Enterobacter soli TaxID=885040 RepID=UPI003EDA3967
MNRQSGVSSLAMVLLLLVLGSLILTGLNQQLETFSALVSGESNAIRHQAGVQSALELGKVQQWALQPDVQCRQTTQQSRVCLRLLNDNQVLLNAGSHDLLLWRLGDITEGRIRFSPHGWSDFCPLKENALCQLP